MITPTTGRAPAKHAASVAPLRHRAKSVSGAPKIEGPPVAEAAIPVTPGDALAAGRDTDGAPGDDELPPQLVTAKSESATAR
ncbi:MAG: hypothetical protein HY048_01155 [Acidobacteria bacterium]|nr:hypothetical protein [Acidobacteriota bacterium]